MKITFPVPDLMKPGVPTLLFLSLAAVLLLSGCGGAKDQYFRLSATGLATAKPTGLAVGIGPVVLPSYVDRAELVFQSGPNQFEIPAKARWAGALADNFSQVLATDIGRRINSGNVVANPAPGDTRFRYRVSVTIRQFHAVSGQGAVLEAAWRVESADTRQVLRHGSADYHSAISGDGYAAVVAAESDLVDQLAESISRFFVNREARTGWE